MELIKIQLQHIPLLFEFECENQSWFEQWVPPRPKGYYDLETFEGFTHRLIQEMIDQKGLYFLGIHSNQIIGRFNIDFIDSHSAEIGYRVAKNHLGQGMGHYFVQLLINQISATGRTQVLAKALIENQASTRILQKQGFIPTALPLEAVALNGKSYQLASYALQLDSNKGCSF